MKVYILTGECRVGGHGESFSYTTLLSKGGYKFVPHPIFSSKAGAVACCATLDEWTQSGVVILEMEVSE